MRKSRQQRRSEQALSRHHRQTLALAQARRDPLFLRLQALWRQERRLDAALSRKYAAAAHLPFRQRVLIFLPRR